MEINIFPAEAATDVFPDECPECPLHEGYDVSEEDLIWWAERCAADEAARVTEGEAVMARIEAEDRLRRRERWEAQVRRTERLEANQRRLERAGCFAGLVPAAEAEQIAATRV